MNLSLIKEQLSILGYPCVICRTGHEALEAWRSGGIGLMLADCTMPEMGGFELTRIIREQERAGEHLSIVAFTGSGTHDQQRFLRAGMDGLLHKPYMIGDLQATLEKFLAD